MRSVLAPGARRRAAASAAAAARAAGALGLALAAARLVHGGRGDPLGRSGAAAAPRCGPLDVLVLPLALVAPGLRHSGSSAPQRAHSPRRSASYARDSSRERGRSRRTIGSSSTPAAYENNGPALWNRS